VLTVFKQLVRRYAPTRSVFSTVARLRCRRSTGGYGRTIAHRSGFGRFVIEKVDIAALLALIAALLSGVGDVIRQRSAQEITDEQVGHLELLRMSLRDVRWWLGGSAAVVSFALQAVALSMGSVVLVQALQVTALLFALPVYAWLTKQGLTRWEWIWALLLAAAVAVFVGVGEPAAGYQRAPLHAWAVVALVIGPAMVFCVVGARIWSGPVAAVLLALVSASSWALFSVLTKAVVDVLPDGPLALLRTPELYGWLLVAGLGTVFQQSAFRASALTASLPTMTVAEPIVASVLGVTVLGETLGADGLEVIALVGAIVVVFVATVALARGEAASMNAEADERAASSLVPSSPTGKA
jgi:drug/metabolite transporter (DMT)-like permease